MRMKVGDVLAAAHIKYEQSVDTPALDDEDGKIRLSLLKEIVQRWRNIDGVKWNELFTINNIGTLTAGTTQYSLDSDIDVPESIYIVGSAEPITVKRAHQITGVEGRYAYILGNPRDGYTLNLGWTPAEGDADIDKTIRVVYYRNALIPKSNADYLEMSDPYYAVNELTAELCAPDDRDLYDLYHGEALQNLENMKERNDSVLVGEDQDDDDYSLGN